MSNDYQARVGAWVHHVFGDTDPQAPHTRVRRFLEEANEYAQSLGVSKEDAIELVNYTWSRPAGEPNQECGGVMTTLAASQAVHGLDDMMECGERELDRVWWPEMIDKIRRKQASKPAGGNLPEPWPRTNPWAAAIDEARVAGCLSPTTPDMDPERALADLISWEVQTALDPAVSPDAAALIEKGRREWWPTDYERSNNTTAMMLSLVGYDVEVDVVARWDAVKCREAYEWAARTHLHASDNPTVEVPHRPSWLPEPWAGPMQGDPNSVMSTNPTIISE